MQPSFPPLPKGHDTFNVDEELGRALLAENNRPWDRRMRIYHPSSLGGCKRNLYLDRIGVMPVRCTEVETGIIFKLGHGIHDWVQRCYGAYCKDFEAEVLLMDDALHLGGSCDGVFKTRGWVLEIKTAGNTTFSSLLRPMKKHLRQVHAYMYMLRIPRAQLLYINRDNGARKMFRVEWDQALWEDILLELRTVEDCVEQDVMPEREVEFMMCKECKYAYMCKPFEGTKYERRYAPNERAVQRAASSGRDRFSLHRLHRSGDTAGAGASVPGEAVVPVGAPAPRFVRRVHGVLRVQNKPGNQAERGPGSGDAET